jgi:hypothetical protein
VRLASGVYSGPIYDRPKPADAQPAPSAGAFAPLAGAPGAASLPTIGSVLSAQKTLPPLEEPPKPRTLQFAEPLEQHYQGDPWPRAAQAAPPMRGGLAASAFMSPLPQSLGLEPATAAHPAANAAQGVVPRPAYPAVRAPFATEQTAPGPFGVANPAEFVVPDLSSYQLRMPPARMETDMVPGALRGGYDRGSRRPFR